MPFGQTLTLAVPRTVEVAGFWVPLTALVEGRKGLWDVYVAEDDPAAE